MRYYNAETVNFTTALGESVPLKEIRERPGRAALSYSVRLDGARFLDEVATRAEALGDGYEAETYRLFEENDVEIVDAGFDLSRLKSLRVPL